jgi:glutathione S-transferase
MSVTIHAFPPSPRSFKVLLAAEYLGIEYRLNFVNLASGDQRTPEAARLNINQRVPVLVDGDYVIWESNAILEYLSTLNPKIGLMPTDERARLQVAKWLYWESAHWDPACIPFVFERVGKTFLKLGPANQSEIDRATGLFERVATILDRVLEEQKFIAGETVSAADVAIAAPLCYARQAGFPLQDHSPLRRWLGEMESLPAWRRTTKIHLDSAQ